MSWNSLTAAWSRHVLVGSLVLAVSVGSTNVFAQSSRAYVTSLNDGTVTAYKLAGNGTPTLIDSYPTVGPGGAAATANGRFLYVANYGSPGCSTPGTVSAFAINPENGRLTAVPGSPFSTGLGPYSVTVSPSGRFVYTANYCDGNISAFRINPASGALIPLSGSPFATGPGPLFVTIDGTSQHAYVDNTGDNTITRYDVAGNGVLTTVGAPASSQGTYPGHVTLAHSGRFAYVANSGSCVGCGDGNLAVFAVDAHSGALSPIPESPYASLNSAASLDFSWAGDFAYLASCAEDAVGGFAVSRKFGTLEVLPGSPYPAGDCANVVTADVTHLFVANSYANTLSVYRINRATGDLLAIPGSPFPVGSYPSSVVIVP